MITADEPLVPLEKVLAACRSCSWTGTAKDLDRLMISEVEIGGDEHDAKVIGQRQKVICSCPGCGGREISLAISEDLPDGRYKIDLLEGLREPAGGAGDHAPG